MSNGFLRFRTAYALEVLEFPECFARLEERIPVSDMMTDQALKSEFVNVARRMGEVDLFASHIEAANVPADPMLAPPLVSAYLTAYLGACKALLDSAAIFLTNLHELGLRNKRQDLRLKQFWDSLASASSIAHDRYFPFKDLCAEVVRWRDAAVHRASPLAILHLSTEKRDSFQPEKGAIRVVADPDWRGAEIGAQTQWLDPLDKHKEWHPRFLSLCEMICADELGRRQP